VRPTYQLQLQRSILGLAVGALLLGVTPASATTVSLKDILLNAVVVKSVPSSPLVIAGTPAANVFLQSALRTYQGFSAKNDAAFTSFTSSTSIAGRVGVVNGALDVGISDAPLNSASNDVSSGALSSYVQIPVGTTADAIVYNLSFPSSVTTTAVIGGQTLTATSGDNCSALLVQHPLVLTPTVLALIFSGQISSWTSSELVLTNPQLNFSALVPVRAATKSQPQRNHLQRLNCLSFVSTPTIDLVGPTSGNGATYLLTQYLSKVDATDFPSASDNALAAVASPLDGDSVVAAAVTSTPGALGYLPWSLAASANLDTARVQISSSGVTHNETVSTTSVRSDLNAGLGRIGGNGGFGVTQESQWDLTLAGAGYPIVGFVFAITKRAQPDAATGIAVGKFLLWLTQAAPSSTSALFGQSLATASYSASLPTTLRHYDLSALQTLTAQGAPAVSATN